MVVVVTVWWSVVFEVDVVIKFVKRIRLALSRGSVFIEIRMVIVL